MSWSCRSPRRIPRQNPLSRVFLRVFLQQGCRPRMCTPPCRQWGLFQSDFLAKRKLPRRRTSRGSYTVIQLMLARRFLVFPLSMAHMIRCDIAAGGARARPRPSPPLALAAAGRHCNFASRNGPCRLSSLKKKVLINMPLCRKCVVELDVTPLNSE